MKILVYGAGVLGCNLERNLFHAGKDVTLLARGNWAEEIRRTDCGSRINKEGSPPAKCREVLREYHHSGYLPEEATPHPVNEGCLSMRIAHSFTKTYLDKSRLKSRC